MTKWLRWMLVAVVAVATSFGSVALGDVSNDDAVNVEEGDNESDTDQEGAGASGDAVAGQVVGSVGAGDSSIDATNRSEDVDVETGDATAENTARSFTGLSPGAETATDTAIATDIRNLGAINVQEGDNETSISQDASASSGDGVGGQVIGVVTSAGGSAAVVASNTSEDVEIDTGDAFAGNAATSFVGLNTIGSNASASLELADIFNASATNVQEGDNTLDGSQDARVATGDGVGGQVLGVVSAGDASLEATNLSEDVEIESGEGEAFNSFLAFTGGGPGFGGGGPLGCAAPVPGLKEARETCVPCPRTPGNAERCFPPGLEGKDLSAADIDNASATNVQEGDNDLQIDQSANVSTGDVVGGQVAGVVTSAGGSADLVLANTTVDAEAESGEGFFTNFDVIFTGLTADGIIEL